jgi:hypothetical protein
MADTIEGIPEKRLDRLKKHLLKAEKLTGKPLRKTPAHHFASCPIGNFAPNKDKDGFPLEAWRGTVEYEGGWRMKYYRIYSPNDTLWWTYLPYELKIKVTKYIQGWIKNRNG